MAFFTGHMSFMSLNQERWSPEGNSEHWPQPVVWPLAFFIHYLWWKERCCLYTSCPMPAVAYQEFRFGTINLTRFLRKILLCRY